MGQSLDVVFVSKIDGEDAEDEDSSLLTDEAAFPPVVATGSSLPSSSSSSSSEIAAGKAAPEPQEDKDKKRLKALLALPKSWTVHCKCYVRKVGFGVHVPEGTGCCRLRGRQNQFSQLEPDVGMIDDDCNFLKARLGKPVY